MPEEEKHHTLIYIYIISIPLYDTIIHDFIVFFFFFFFHNFLAFMFIIEHVHIYLSANKKIIVLRNFRNISNNAMSQNLKIATCLLNSCDDMMKEMANSSNRPTPNNAHLFIL